MATDQILDLFSLSTDDAAASVPNLPSSGSKVSGGDAAGVDSITEDDAVDVTGNLREKGKRGFLDDIGELWDERQYAEEYDLDAFLASMKG